MVVNKIAQNPEIVMVVSTISVIHIVAILMTIDPTPRVRKMNGLKMNRSVPPRRV